MGMARLPGISRASAPLALLSLMVLAYGWTVARDLTDLSSRLSPDSGAVEQQLAPASDAPAIFFDAIDTVTLTWFGSASDPAEPVVIASSGRRQGSAPDQMGDFQEPPPAVSQEATFTTFPSIKLSGVFLGTNVREALAEVDGEKRRIKLGADVNGWRLVVLRRTSAVFQSSDGRQEIIRLYPNSL